MSQVIANATVSLDGFIAYSDNSVGDLFEWYGNGDVEVMNAGELAPFHLSPKSAEYWTAWVNSLGALVVGRTLFDVTDGWGGEHPLGVPVVVLTHRPPQSWSYPGSDNFHFVTEGIEAAVAKAVDLASGKNVGVAAGTIAAQALEAGLLDAIAMDVAPIVLGSGRRFFGDLPLDTVRLADADTVVQGERVTHLRFPVRRADGR